MAKHDRFTEHFYQTAEELWQALSPTHEFKKGHEDFVYRGQADARWGLLPTILRPRNVPPIVSYTEMVDASDMVFYELAILQRFAKHCDDVGIPIPNDSQTFRKTILDTQTADRFYKDPSLWPNPEILDFMAMAQHHGVPTRLLDWTTRSFTAAYFAASSAIARFSEWGADDRLVIWAMDRVGINLHSRIVLHHAPGAVSRHLAAQGGLFTVHPHTCVEGGSFVIEGLETLLEDIDSTPFLKLTLPVYEAARLLHLCSRAGFNAATIYPTADGAGRAVLDDMNTEGARTRWNIDSIRVR
ncbi:FRG domain-containing protein [Pseudomonas fulva]|uniref:FRG domain-containing protein n=1 Tax=Pseudomonas TaxID=286 RepID=UPI001FFCF98B|nr:MULTISPECIES: FRG domain-containing protein [Pseudomonas]MCK2116099.1 FRG domain-containing protein [Pseudomonas juntendi]MDH1308137.1 FRG domain-containing protein [Pseudomonas fulva]